MNKLYKGEIKMEIKRYIRHLDLSPVGSLFLTDRMETYHNIEEAINACDSKILIMNQNFKSDIAISDATLTPEEIKNKVARRDIYCREVTFSYHKTGVVLERFSIGINGSDPILFVFDYPFIYGSKSRDSIKIGDPVRLIRSHKYYRVGFDHMNQRLKSRKEFLSTKMSIREIISRGRFICGYQYTRSNKGKNDVEYRSVGEMWIMDGSRPPMRDI